jgi:heme exporter protein D
VAEGAVDEALQTLDRPENRERLARILASPPMRKAVHDLTASLVAGIFDGVDVARGKGQLPGVPDNLGRTIGQSLAHDIAPAAGRFVRRSVDAALDEALSDEHVGRMEQLVHRVGGAAATEASAAIRDEMAPALASAIERDIGPAIAVLLARDLLPAAGRGLSSPEMQEALMATGASLAVGVARGTSDGLDEVAAQNRRDGKEGTVSFFGRSLALGVVVAMLVAVAFGVLLIAVTVLLVRSNRQQRRLVEDSRQREERFLAVLERHGGAMGHEPVTSTGPIT